MSISKKIICSILVFIILGFGIFITINYNTSKQDILTSITAGKQETIRNAESFVHEFFTTKIKGVEIFAKEIEKSSDLSVEHLRAMLKDAFTYTQIDALFIGYEADGLLIKTDDISNNQPWILTPAKDNFDSRTRAWFKEELRQVVNLDFLRPITTSQLANLSQLHMHLYLSIINL